MRIVDVCAFYSPHGGGVRTYVEQKLRAGPALGHEIVILAPGEDHRVEQRGPNARIVYLPGPRFPLDRRYRFFADDGSVEAALTALAPDMVEASSPWRSAELVANWQGGAPRALVMHADPLASYAYRWFGMVARQQTIDRSFGWFWRHLRKLDRGFDRIVAANHGFARRLEAGGMRNLLVNPMGVTPGLFSPARRDPELRRTLLARCGLGDEGTLVLGVGRHAPEKRWPMVIDACVAAGTRRPIGLVLVGDGRERHRLATHIGGNPHVQLIAPLREREQFARLLASGDALIHGCESETFCMVAAEARASGLPVVAPAGGGAADLARGWGELYVPGSAADAARALGRLLDRPAGPALDEAPRTMDDHFATLFADYQALAEARRAA